VTDIPDEVYKYLEWLADSWVSHSPRAKDLLAKYPRSQPEPAWQDGDVVLVAGNIAALRLIGRWTFGDDSSISDGVAAEKGLEPVIHAGRRVHPPRFAEHASDLRGYARAVSDGAKLNPSVASEKLRRIAADLAGDNDD
jgi:hypothetical protein